MSASAWRALRWLIALGLCVLLVLIAVPAAFDAIRSSVEIRDQERQAEGADTPSGRSGPVRDGGAAAKTDFAVRGATVRDSDATRLTVTGPSSDSGLVAGFDLIEGAPGCVASLELAVDVVEASSGELGVHAAAINDVEALTDGDTVEQVALSEEAHAVAVSDGTPGRLSWDLTDLYARWTEDLAPPETPLVVVIRPQQEGQEIRVASTESDDSAGPRLRWTGEEGCS